MSGTTVTIDRSPSLTSPLVIKNSGTSLPKRNTVAHTVTVLPNSMAGKYHILQYKDSHTSRTSNNKAKQIKYTFARMNPGLTGFLPMRKYQGADPSADGRVTFEVEVEVPDSSAPNGKRSFTVSSLRQLKNYYAMAVAMNLRLNVYMILSEEFTTEESFLVRFHYDMKAQTPAALKEAAPATFSGARRHKHESKN